jgi:hypothetical protein
MSNIPVGGRSSETQSHPINTIINYAMADDPSKSKDAILEAFTLSSD